MENEDYKIQTIRNVINWGNKDIKFYKGKFPDERFEKFKTINAFAQTIESDFETKFEEVKKHFSEEFE